MSMVQYFPFNTIKPTFDSLFPSRVAPLLSFLGRIPWKRRLCFLPSDSLLTHCQTSPASLGRDYASFLEPFPVWTCVFTPAQCLPASLSCLSELEILALVSVFCYSARNCHSLSRLEQDKYIILEVLWGMSSGTGVLGSLLMVSWGGHPGVAKSMLWSAFPSKLVEMRLGFLLLWDWGPFFSCGLLTKGWSQHLCHVVGIWQSHESVC